MSHLCGGEGDEIRSRLFQFTVCGAAPRAADDAIAFFVRGDHVKLAVADHDGIFGRDIGDVFQQIAENQGLVMARTGEVVGGEEGEIAVQIKMGKQPLDIFDRLGGDGVQEISVLLQGIQQGEDTVIYIRLKQAAFCVLFAIDFEHPTGVLGREAEVILKRIDHRGAYERRQFLGVLGNGKTHGGHRVGNGVDDAACGLGQCSVNIK